MPRRVSYSRSVKNYYSFTYLILNICYAAKETLCLSVLLILLKDFKKDYLPFTILNQDSLLLLDYVKVVKRLVLFYRLVQLR
jgi:uncharacterized membrane protein